MEHEKWLRELDELKKAHRSFKKRVSVILNLFIPGIGFFIYGSAHLKGLISFVLFVTYNYLFFEKIAPNTDPGVAAVYYIPAVVIWIVSAAMVASLDD